MIRSSLLFVIGLALFTAVGCEDKGGGGAAKAGATSGGGSKCEKAADKMLDITQQKLDAMPGDEAKKKEMGDAIIGAMTQARPGMIERCEAGMKADPALEKVIDCTNGAADPAAYEKCDVGFKLSKLLKDQKDTGRAIAKEEAAAAEKENNAADDAKAEE